MARLNSELKIGRKYCTPGMSPQERLEHVGYTVTATGCWEWNGGKHTAGYGVMNVWGKSMYAHRVSLEIKLGRDILPGLYACHVCDNPPCCNPEHLFEGTALDNSRDSNSKGRASGGRVGNKATTYPIDVFELVESMAARGAKCAEISAAAGISKSYTYALLNGSRTRPINYRKEAK